MSTSICCKEEFVQNYQRNLEVSIYIEAAIKVVEGGMKVGCESSCRSGEGFCESAVEASMTAVEALLP